MKLVPTTRSKCFERLHKSVSDYQYFFYEEDEFISNELDSKFVSDEIYDDSHVHWFFIVENGIIVGLIATALNEDVLHLKFLEIGKQYRSQRFGSAVLSKLKDDYDVIVLYPKDESVVGFYRSNDFSFLDDQMIWSRFEIEGMYG